jgi:hypothetical protein
VGLARRADLVEVGRGAGRPSGPGPRRGGGVRARVGDPYELEGIFSATGLDEGDFFGAGALVDALAEADGDIDDALMALSIAAASDSSAATAADALAWRTRRQASRA